MLPFFPVLQPLSGSLSLASRKSVFSPSPGFFQHEYGDLLIVMRVMGVPGKSVTETIVTLSGLSGNRNSGRRVCIMVCPSLLGRLLYAYLHPLLGADELSG